MDEIGKFTFVGAYYEVGKRLGSGTFGELRLGVDRRTNEKVAIKFESVRVKKSSLDLEYKFYKNIGACDGLPKVMYYGRCGSFYVLVMQLLGLSIEDLFDKCNRTFNFYTTCGIAKQIISRIETIHDKCLLYRDIKPENFLFGLEDKADIIHIIDFGLAKHYMDPDSGRHIAYREHKPMTGTPRYMSINGHLGRELSRRDDLEAIGYLLVYFTKGTLPWQGIQAANIRERYSKVAQIKLSTNAKTLCNGLPPEFATYVDTVRNYDFFETPDYEYLRGLFTAAQYRLAKEGKDQYDWAPFMKAKEPEVKKRREKADDQIPVKEENISNKSS